MDLKWEIVDVVFLRNGCSYVPSGLVECKLFGAGLHYYFSYMQYRTMVMNSFILQCPYVDMFDVYACYI